jgi:hypothetical protein
MIIEFLIVISFLSQTAPSAPLLDIEQARCHAPAGSSGVFQGVFEYPGARDNGSLRQGNCRV